MKSTRLLNVILLCVFWTFHINAQVIVDENVDFVHENIHVLRTESIIGGAELRLKNPYLTNNTSNFHQKFAIEVVLEYSKDEFTELENNFWQYDITFDLITEYPSSNLILSKTLSIENTSNKGVHESAFRMIDLPSNLDENSDIVLKITNFSPQTIGQSEIPDDIDVKLKLVHINQEKKDSYVAMNLVATENYNKNENGLETTGNSYIDYRWADFDNIAYFDFAYVYVDDLDGAGFNIEEDFLDRAIIISTDKNWHRLDISYPPGVIYAIVRPVFKRFTNGEYDGNMEIPWQFVKNGQILYKTSYISNNSSLKPHEEDHNWEFTTSFAEEGKYKKTLSYFDNTLRSKQTITYLNDEELALVAETDYDEEGRSSLQILPVPVLYDGGNNLFFKTNFNLDNTGSPYSYKNIEKPSADPLSTTSGAGLYYSESNPLKDMGYHNRFIPDADGYVYTQTKYERNNTGRIKAQSGIGEQFKLTSGHETKYFYTTPSQTELSRMFGHDIGKAKHYKKNITIDPNGQASVSIMDNKENVVATYLMNNSPDNVLVLESNESVEEIEALVVDHHKTATEISSFNTYVKTTPEDQSQEITINYNVEGDVLIFDFLTEDEESNPSPPPAEEFCFSCPYTVSIKVLDPCGNYVDLTYNNSETKEVILIQDPIINGPIAEGSDCSGESPLTSQATILVKDLELVGEYIIEKKLTTVQPSYELVEQAVTDLIDIAQIVTEISVEEDYRHCFTSCEEYCAFMASEFGVNEADCILEEDCDNMYNNIITGFYGTECQLQLASMERHILDIPDIVLAGNTYDDLDFASFPLHLTDELEEEYIFDGSNIIHTASNEVLTSGSLSLFDAVDEDYDVINLLDSNGDPDENVIMGLLYDFGNSNFHRYWQDQFASSLVPWHREFCHYNRCGGLTDSKIFDAQLPLISDIEAAFLHFNATGNGLSAKLTNLLSIMQAQDGFFAVENASVICPDNTDPTSLFNKIVDDYHNRTNGIGMVNFIDFMVYLDDNFENPPFSDVHDPATKNEVLWSMFYSSYIAFKREAMEKEDDDDGPGCGCMYFKEDPSDPAFAPGTIIHPKSPYHETNDYVDAITYVNNIITGGNAQFNNEENCQTRAEAIMDVYIQEYAPDVVVTSPDDDAIIQPLIDAIDDYCVEQCGLFPQGSCYESTLPLFHNMFDYSGPGSTDCFQDTFTFEGKIIHSNNINDSYDDFTSGPVNFQAVNTSIQPQDLYSSSDNCSEVEDRLGELLVILKGCETSGRQRLIVHTNNCDGMNYSDIGVRILDISNVPYEIICGYTTNKYQDLVLEWDHPAPLNGMNIVIQFYTLEDIHVDKYFSFEYYNNWGYESSEFLSFDDSKNNIHLNGLKQIYDEMEAVTCNLHPSGLPDCKEYHEQNYDKVISAAWNCENACGELDVCFDEILNIVTDYINTSNIPSTAGTAIYPIHTGISNSGCHGDINLHYISDGPNEVNKYWYVEVKGASILGSNPNEIVRLRLITDAGFVPDLSRVNDPANPSPATLRIVDWAFTNSGYDLIESYQNDEYFIPNLKFLIKSEDVDDVTMEESVRFNTAYLMVERKQALIEGQLYSDCTEPINPDETMDCLAEMEENILIKAEHIYRELVNAKVEKILNYNCVEGMQETMTRTSTFSNHHYTLYYYDVVGNLLKTVPPAGVNLLPLSEFANGVLNPTAENPNHKKVTTYKYNSFNNIIESNTHDAGITKYYYDRAQRLRFSQNAEQALGLSEYSYTLYDALGRVTETGEVELTPGNTLDISQAIKDPTKVVDDNVTSYTLKDRVLTTYSDTDDMDFDEGLGRNRVVQLERYNGPDENNNIDIVKTQYQYDSHGNVRALKQTIPNLPSKILDYDFDLISGNMHGVAYNKGKDDQVFFRYKYDSDNRLKQAFSSFDGILWNEDAKYIYYKHGPLARMESGHYKVSGMDYVYTLQGWIKSVNLPGIDIPDGEDAGILGEHRWVAKDQMKYALGYYDGDYKPINTSFNMGIAQNPHATILNNDILDGGLYNGNISAMLTSLRMGTDKFNTQTHAYAYKYDQLHRIKNAYSYLKEGSADLARNTDLSYKQFHSFDARYHYDADGNLTVNATDGFSMARAGLGMMRDELSHDYGLMTLKKNTLSAITDATNSNNYGDDFDGNEDFVYDAIGNLIESTNEGTTVHWDSYNKVSRIEDNNGGEVRYLYDGTGERVAKIQPNPTVSGSILTSSYIRDASGNIISIYQEESTPPVSVRASAEAMNGSIVQKEVNLFGSSRLGTQLVDRSTTDATLSAMEIDGQRAPTSTRYELSNHLGNVLSTISGRKFLKGQEARMAQSSTNTGLYYYQEVISNQDYYPFGDIIHERTWKNPDFAGTDSHRYGFNGKEKDENNEFGSLTHYDYGFRIYNPSFGRFLSVDPLADKFTEWSPYHYATNNPINIIDYDGRDTVPANSGLTPYLINKPKPFTPMDIVRQGNDVTTKVGAIFTAAGILTSPEDIAKLIQSQKGVFFDMSSANGSLQLTGNETNDDIAKMLQKIGGKNLTVSNTASVLDGVGKSLFYVGAAFSAVEGVYNFNEGNYVDAAGNVSDIFFGAVGTWGGLPGAIISTLYFGPKIYYNNGGKERGEALGREMMRKQEEGNLYHPKLNKSRQMKNPKK